MGYVERAIVVADHEREVRIVIEPGYLDDRDRECLRFMVDVKGTTGELRLPTHDAKMLAFQIIEQVVGRRVKLIIKKAGRE